MVFTMTCPSVRYDFSCSVMLPVYLSKLFALKYSNDKRFSHSFVHAGTSTVSRLYTLLQLHRCILHVLWVERSGEIRLPEDASFAIRLYCVLFSEISSDIKDVFSHPSRLGFLLRILFQKLRAACWQLCTLK